MRYWENTVFLVVADHGVGINGGTLVPIERFKRKALAYALWGPMAISNKAYYNYPGDR
jgi:hypothetical protein